MFDILFPPLPDNDPRGLRSARDRRIAPGASSHALARRTVIAAAGGLLATLVILLFVVIAHGPCRHAILSAAFTGAC